MTQDSGLFKNTAVFVTACLLAAIFFLFLYQYDNKYTLRAPVDPNGMTSVDSALQADRAVYLVEGWQLYPDALLSPKETADPSHRSQDTYIGQYFSLAPFHQDGSPYGKATYKLRLGKVSAPSLMVLQEVFSACKVFVNGAPAASSGSFSPYAPYVKDLTVEIPVGEAVEIVIQTANYTHYYSGVTYPPVFGTSQAIHLHSFYRTLFYGFLCFFSLSLVLFSVCVWLGCREKEGGRISLWFGLLALSFAVRISYPFFRTAGFSQLRLLYALEDSAFLFGIWCALKIVLCFTGFEKAALGKVISQIGLHLFLAGTVFPWFFLPLLPAFTPVYGQIIYWYKLLTAVLLAVLAFYGVLRRGVYANCLLSGVGIYGVSLLFHALTLNRYEPAVTGWQDEYGSFALVLCFSVVVVSRTVELVRENRLLNKHLQEQVDEKTRSLNAVLEERRHFLVGAAHDLKAPMTSLQLFAQAVEEGGIQLDGETLNNLRMIRRKSDEMQERLELIQTFAAEDLKPRNMEAVDLEQLVKKFHEANLPDMEVSGINFPLSTSGPCVICGDCDRLERILQNLVYNALSFTPMDGTISISLTKTGGEAVLEITDTGCGIEPEDLPCIFNRFFSRRQDGSGSGLGLYLVKSFVEEHGGRVTADSELGKGSCFTVIFPLFK